jgi:NADPH:quinone reductase-like Zn-dependent oxidoreductase
MILGLAESYQIAVISIVRREEQMAELSVLGAAQLLNSSEEEFEDKLRNIAAELDATLFLDAVTGSQTSLLLRAAPKGSTLIVYARLSGEPMEVDPGLLIKEDKRIEGFQLGNWLQSKGMITKLRYLRRVKKELPVKLASHIAGTLPIDFVDQAIDHYKTDMSGGKWILRMGVK